MKLWKTRKQQHPTPVGKASFYFDFQKGDKPRAEDLRVELIQEGFNVSLGWRKDLGAWSLIATKSVTSLQQVIETSEIFDAMAELNNYDYDGHDVDAWVN